MMSTLFNFQLSIRNHLSEAYKKNIEEHNKEVKKNRKILNIILDTVLLCGRLDLSLRGHDESDESANPGVFRSLLEFAASLDEDMLQRAIKMHSKTIQDEVLFSCLSVYKSLIKKEILNASFVSILADDTTDFSESVQTVIVFRYLVKDEVKERFWGFFKPENQKASGIADCILSELDSILGNDVNKLVCQTYDGASVMSGKNQGVQAKIQQKYHCAWFVHCHAHQVNLIVSNACNCNKGARIFFSNVEGLTNYFSKSPQRLNVLLDSSSDRLPRNSGTRWNFKHRSISKIKENFDSIVLVLTKLETGNFSKETVSRASGFLKIVQSGEFKFWLNLFYHVLYAVNIFFLQMQKLNLTVDETKTSIDNFKSQMQLIRNSDKTFSEISTLNQQAKEVLDTIMVRVSSRFKFTGHLLIHQLFDQEKFSLYIVDFPNNLVSSVKTAYPFVNTERLVSELNVFYPRLDIPSFNNSKELLSVLLNNNLDIIFVEITKVLKIINTIPLTTCTGERCFSTLRRIKDYLRNTLSQKKLNSLAALSCNKKITEEFPSFKDEVINNFIKSKNRKLKLNYK